MENYDKLTKQELIALLSDRDKVFSNAEVLISENKSLKAQTKELLTTRDTAINAEYTIRKDMEELKKQAETLISENESLKTRVTELSTTRDMAINAEYTIRKDMEELNKQVAALTGERDYLKKELDTLADLFNEHAKAFKDQTLMLDVFVNNAKSINQFMENKIAQYNMRNLPKEQGDKKR